MKIEKRRVKKWSLEEIEATPGITTLQIMERCVKVMYDNGWEFTEMADWFNRQKDSAGRPKFLNAAGKPLTYQNCSHLYSMIKPRRKKARLLAQRPKKIYSSHNNMCNAHRHYILELERQRVPSQEIILKLRNEFGFKCSLTTLNRFIEAVEKETAVPMTANS